MTSDQRPNVEFHTTGYPDPDLGPWMVTTFWQEHGGRMECAGISIRSDAYAGSDPFRKPPGPMHSSDPETVTTTLLRSLPVARLVREARAYMASVHEDRLPGGRTALEHERADGTTYVLGARTAERLRDAYRQTGSRTYGREHYEEVARQYRVAWKAHDPAPTRAVQEWAESVYGGPISRSAAANWVARCRQLGLLGPTEKRKAGGVSPKEES